MEGSAGSDDLTTWELVPVGRCSVVRRRFLERGSGDETPRGGSVCRILIQSNATDPLCSQLIPYPVNHCTLITMGEGECDIIEGVLEGMRAGERCAVVISTLTPLVKSDEAEISGLESSSCLQTQELRLTLQLHSFTPGRDSWELSFDEKLGSIVKHKQRGGARFRAGDVWGAAHSYSLAMRLAVTLQMVVPAEQDPEFQRARSELHANLAACQLRLGQPRNALLSATRALGIQPRCAKALYRRGLALTMLGEFEQARADLRGVLELEPASKPALQALRDLERREREQRGQLARAMSKLFN
ncbi:FKBPL protein, partial [Polyodon spathula]|nr:FK506-binding protein-like [Polyodon spathula]XP_041082491.1 FK506-binding protein-like [Polyodon spathula]XP_041082492.1 FK506-binding protein-like [Polyodon spathula]XP_041082493.1 FK506-binding protein-like [Polyodon spathula]MBN3277469.1 FKBPL protein [Polyodon spathula]